MLVRASIVFSALVCLGLACSSTNDAPSKKHHPHGKEAAGGGGSSGESGGVGGSGGAASTGGGNPGTGGTQEVCTATFHWLQKDAYKSTAGRSSNLWPPHTTTVFDVTCNPGDGSGDQMVASGFQDNHGTDPGAVDVNGVVILVETKTATATGSRADLLNLFTTYQACLCDPETQFLSLDSLGDDDVQKLLGDVVSYLQTNLSCTSAGGIDALIQSLQAGDIETVIGDLPSCSWQNGTDFTDGLNQALTDLIQDTQASLQDYHVCNNDAFLQATLFENYAAGKGIAACDMSSPTCHGPKWFYQP